MKMSSAVNLRVYTFTLSSADNLCIQFVPRSRPDILSGLVVVQTVYKGHQQTTAKDTHSYKICFGKEKNFPHL